jgi:HK97 family phage portal protein
MIGRIQAAFGGVSKSQSPDLWLINAFAGGRRTSSGIDVTPDTSMTLSVYFACARVLGEDIAKLPVVVVRKLKPKGREEVPGHLATRMIGSTPNPEMPAQAFIECLTVRAATWGGGFAEIQRLAGAPIALWPIHPSRVKISRMDGEKVYHVRNDDPIALNMGAGQWRAIPDADMFEIQGLSRDGYHGYSVADLAAESVGAGIAAQRFGGSFFANGAGVGGVLSTDKHLDPEAMRTMRESWNEAYSGPDNSNKIAFLGDGFKFQQYGIPPESAQFLETREFSVVDICRWFRMSPVKVQDYSHAHYANIEHAAIDHVTDTLMPWLIRWEKQVGLKLGLAADEQLKFNVNALMRGDSTARAAYIDTSIGNGTITINEAREQEDRNPVPRGDDPLDKSNNLETLSRVVSGEAKQQAPPPGGRPPPGEPAEDETEEDDAQQRLKLSMMPVFAEAAGRMVSRMSVSAKRAAKSKSYEAWAAEFGDRQAAVMTEALSPPAVSMLRMMGRLPSLAADIVAVYAEKEVREAMAELRDSWTVDAVTMTTNRWAADRPARMAVELTDLIGAMP